MKESIKSKQEKEARRARRVRAKILGTKERPRLSVYLSNRHMLAQFIDDEQGKTILGISDIILEAKANPHTKADALARGRRVNVERAHAFGSQVAAKAKAQGINTVIFDRGARSYHGRLRAFAEGAREGGLKF